jgi:hypothetical protein
MEFVDKVVDRTRRTADRITRFCFVARTLLLLVRTKLIGDDARGLRTLFRVEEKISVPDFVGTLNNNTNLPASCIRERR